MLPQARIIRVLSITPNTNETQTFM
jgi:hypothetical protein